MDKSKPEQSDDNKPLSEKVGRRAERKQRAREQNKPTAWFGLGMFGLVGWSIAIPTLLGTFLGLWLDGLYPGRASWTLTFLILGLTLGCFIAWYWVKQESRHE